MADEEVWQDHRPPGDWLVELNRPIGRFGWMLKVGVRDTSGNIWLARVGPHGYWQFREYAQDTEALPALFLDDFLVAAMRKVLDGEPVRLNGDAPYEHLKDAVQTRDRLLAMIEQEWAARAEGVK
jgi:hypothetical protein